jgi:hypothetical protein
MPKIAPPAYVLAHLETYRAARKKLESVRDQGRPYAVDEASHNVGMASRDLAAAVDLWLADTETRL